MLCVMQWKLSFNYLFNGITLYSSEFNFKASPYVRDVIIEIKVSTRVINCAVDSQLAKSGCSDFNTFIATAKRREKNCKKTKYLKQKFYKVDCRQFLSLNKLFQKIPEMPKLRSFFDNTSVEGDLLTIYKISLA